MKWMGKVITNIQEGKQKLTICLDRATVESYKLKYKLLSKDDLNKSQKEAKENYENAVKKVKEQNMTFNIIDSSVNKMLIIAVPGGTALVAAKKIFEPVRMYSCELQAIKELKRENRRKLKKTVKESVNIDSAEIELNLTEVDMSEVLESCDITKLENGFFVNYTNLNGAVMTPEDENTILSLKGEDYAEIQEKIKEKQKSSTEGGDNISNFYKTEINDNLNLPPIMAKKLESCLINPVNPGGAVLNILDVLEECNSDRCYADMLVTKILPLASKLSQMDETFDELLECTGTIIRRNMVEEFKSSYKNVVPYRYLLREATLEMESNKFSNKIVSVKKELDTLIKKTMNDKDLNKIYETDDKLNHQLSNAKHVYSNLVRESMYMLCKDDTTEITLEQLSLMTSLMVSHNALLEATNAKKGHNSPVWKAGHAIDKKSREILNNGKDSYDTTVRNNQGVAHAAQNVEKLINYPINKIVVKDKNERRTRLIEGRWRLKIWKLIRKAMGMKVLHMAGGPVMAAVGAIASIALDKTLDKKVRNDIVIEMETELRITQEKIQDASNKGDTKEKYQLMRLEETLKKDIERIRYSLKGNY